jgi:hypothetical protein
MIIASLVEKAGQEKTAKKIPARLLRLASLCACSNLPITL